MRKDQTTKDTNIDPIHAAIGCLMVSRSTLGRHGLLDPVEEAVINSTITGLMQVRNDVHCLLNDVHCLLAELKAHQENTGEQLEGEDAAVIKQISDKYSCQNTAKEVHCGEHVKLHPGDNRFIIYPHKEQCGEHCQHTAKETPVQSWYTALQKKWRNFRESIASK
jgi:hypothetical protein